MWRLGSFAEFLIFHKIAAKLMAGILNIIDILIRIAKKIAKNDILPRYHLIKL